MKAKFEHFDLKIVNPSFDSPLTSTIIELEKLRTKRLGGRVHPIIFFQIKHIFQLLESLHSARIEGNNTTVLELVEKEIENKVDDNEKIREIKNSEKAMDFIEENVNSHDSKINQAFILELHKIVVDNLTEEGSRSPGMLRNIDVDIKKSLHKPPIHIKVMDYFNELIDFINKKTEKKYNLLITAIAHHRFAWIHPFDNGNGRVVRLLTYAMLIKQGFNVQRGRIINPSAIFCIDRDKYYEMLAKADSGKDDNIILWCHYVLDGLLKEINKIDDLQKSEYLVKKILLPALNFSLERQNITRREYDILRLSVTNKLMVLTSSDLNKLIPNKLPQERSRIIRKLRQRKMLLPTRENARKYVIYFQNNYLLRGVIHALSKEGFIGTE